MYIHHPHVSWKKSVFIEQLETPCRFACNLQEGNMIHWLVTCWLWKCTYTMCPPKIVCWIVNPKKYTYKMLQVSLNYSGVLFQQLCHLAPNWIGDGHHVAVFPRRLGREVFSSKPAETRYRHDGEHGCRNQIHNLCNHTTMWGPQDR